VQKQLNAWKKAKQGKKVQKQQDAWKAKQGK